MIVEKLQEGKRWPRCACARVRLDTHCPEGQNLADLLWALAGFGAASAPLAAGFAATLVRRRRRHATSAKLAAGRFEPDYHLSPSIEDAERSMAVLLRRMQAYIRDPYDFTASRITSEAAFEECLNRAAALGTRITELGGAAPASQAECERARGLILEGMMARHRMRLCPPSQQAGAARHAASPRRAGG